jgi:hypothetical protein
MGVAVGPARTGVGSGVLVAVGMGVVVAVGESVVVGVAVGATAVIVGNIVEVASGVISGSGWAQAASSRSGPSSNKYFKVVMVTSVLNGGDQK